MAFKPICLALVLGCGISLPAASHNDISDYNSYVEGALQVYAKFKEPIVSKSLNSSILSYKVNGRASLVLKIAIL